MNAAILAVEKSVTPWAGPHQGHHTQEGRTWFPGARDAVWPAGLVLACVC